MTPYFLLTDIFIWLLVLGIVVYARSVMASPLSRENWRLVFQSKIASSCAVILAFALGITLLDSIHLRLNADHQAKYGSPIISVLDVAVGELAYERETSYSAPLATRALSKSTIETDSGPIRDYARLKYGGAHLEDESNQTSDLLVRAYKGVLAGGLLWMLSLVLIWVILRSTRKGDEDTPSLFYGSPTTNAVVWTLLVVLVIGGVIAQWAEGYHVLGTDKVGVDVLYSSLKSLRTAMLIGLLTTLLTLPLGIAMGLAAGYFQGWVDDVIQYIYTTLNSIPSVLLIAATVLMLQVALEANPEFFSSSVEKADLRLFFLCA
ncbi:MAG: ABC transporter permease, partial [Limnobacter sp.]|nr:ABC transporter permease [Limnobacter sp.]